MRKQHEKSVAESLKVVVPVTPNPNPLLLKVHHNDRITAFHHHHIHISLSTIPFHPHPISIFHPLIDVLTMDNSTYLFTSTLSSLSPSTSAMMPTPTAAPLFDSSDPSTDPVPAHHASPVVAFMIGLVIITLASILNAAGLNLTKLDHVRHLPLFGPRIVTSYVTACVRAANDIHVHITVGSHERNTKSESEEGLVAPFMALGHGPIHVRVHTSTCVLLSRAPLLTGPLSTAHYSLPAFSAR